MLVFLLSFLALCLWLVKAHLKGFNADFLAKDRTDAVKGFFIVVVFISHIREYYAMAGANLTRWYDDAFFLPAKVFGQLMVVMFLFYSGYGVMESIKRKGMEYVRSIPRKRVLGTLVNFDVAVMVFAVASLLLGIGLTWEQFVLSLPGWDSVGNSNWYIFDIVVCYALTWLAFRWTKQGGHILCWLVIAFAVTMSFLKGTWWYNTLFAYAAGVVFSVHKAKCIEAWKSNYMKWLCILGGSFVGLLGLYLAFYVLFKGELEQIGAFVFNLMSVFFAFTVVLLTMKVRFGNKALYWLGRNLFPLYIYQRLSMMVITELWPGFVSTYPYCFLLACAGVTCLIAYLYRYINIKIG